MQVSIKVTDVVTSFFVLLICCLLSTSNLTRLNYSLYRDLFPTDTHTRPSKQSWYTILPWKQKTKGWLEDTPQCDLEWQNTESKKIVGVARFFFFWRGEGGQSGWLPGLCPPPLLSLCAHNAAPVQRFPLPAAAAMLDTLSMCPETQRTSSPTQTQPPTDLNRSSPPAPLQSPRNKSRCRKSPRDWAEHEAGGGGTPRQLKQRGKRRGAHRLGGGGLANPRPLPYGPEEKAVLV